MRTEIQALYTIPYSSVMSVKTKQSFVVKESLFTVISYTFRNNITYLPTGVLFVDIYFLLIFTPIILFFRSTN